MAAANLPPYKWENAQKATAAAATAVVITITAAPNQRIVAGYILWSYTAAPTGGGLTIEDGSGNVKMDFDITTSGPGALLFPNIAGLVNTALIVTLKSGGGTVVGKLNVVPTLG